jgi:HSP20 family molecular chaperone IbpA
LLKDKEAVMVNTRTKVFSFPHSRFIGFDHVWNEIERLTEMGANEKGFPRHNIVKYSDTEYAMEFALGGYRKKDLEIEAKPGVLIVKGNPEDDKKEYLHKGITTKKFVETFRLADHVVVDGAEFVNGLLVIKLRVELPEEQRPRKIEIQSHS